MRGSGKLFSANPNRYLRGDNLLAIKRLDFPGGHNTCQLQRAWRSDLFVYGDGQLHSDTDDYAQRTDDLLRWRQCHTDLKQR
jgi:hypothetical protein